MSTWTEKRQTHSLHTGRKYDESQTQKHKHYLSFSEEARTQSVAILQNTLGLLRRDVYLQSRGGGGVDETINDGGTLLLDRGLIAVGVTEVLEERALFQYPKFCCILNPTVVRSMFSNLEPFAFVYLYNNRD